MSWIPTQQVVFTKALFYISKMKVILLVISFLLFFLLHECNAQLLINTSNGYILNSVEYENNAEILDLLSVNPRAKMAFQKSRWEKKRANIFGITSIVTFTACPLLLSQFRNSDDDSLNGGFILMGVSAGLVGGFSGLMGINYFINSRNTKRKTVVNIYNNDLLSFKSYNGGFEISIDASENGIGLLVRF